MAKLRRCKSGATGGCYTEKLKKRKPGREQQNGEMTELEPRMILFEPLNPAKT